jgi:tyrosine-protein phosphatase OCA6
LLHPWRAQMGDADNVAPDGAVAQSSGSVSAGHPERKLITLVPPTRFAHVNPGITRGAYPTLRNFRFLSRLQLKTIISLTPEAPTPDVMLFAEMAGVRVVHIPIARMATLSDAVQCAVLLAVNVRQEYPAFAVNKWLTPHVQCSLEQICIEANNHPVYLHCLDGRRISSLVVLLLRRVQGWSPLTALSEYWRCVSSESAQSPQFAYIYSTGFR